MAQGTPLRAWFHRVFAGRRMRRQPLAALDAAQAAYVLDRAYIPEHIPGLMSSISGVQPALIEDHLCFAQDDGLIFVGYPLDGAFTVERSAAAVARARAVYHPRVLWFIGPEIPPDLAAGCRDRQSDAYYRLDLPASPTAALRREVRVAAASLTVSAARAFTHEHQALAEELLARQPVPPMVAALYRAMPGALARASSAVVLDARAASGALAAFYVVEEAAPAFDTYVLGAYSRRTYVPHASDLLCAAMIERAQARGKPAISLGLGINPGIRRFKEKWGGLPYLAYAFCECRFDGGRPVTDLLLEWRL